MRIGMLAFTERGWVLSGRLAAQLQAEKDLAALQIRRVVKCEALGTLSDSRSAKEVAAAYWQETDVIIFVGAVGIAVRLIAPLLQHKAKDPAVLVVDEQGLFCISLLSGHLGGANAWTRRAADILGAQPVITTATDVSQRFAADLFAEENDLVITDFAKAKRVSARALQDLPIRIYSEFPAADLRLSAAAEQIVFLPHERMQEADIRIGMHRSTEGTAPTGDGIGLFLPPRCLWIGIGARRNASAEAVETAITRGLAVGDFSAQAVCGLASIDLKRNEAGILAWARARKLPFQTYPAEELQRLPGVYTESAFVQSVTGVANVCERAAMCAAGPGARLLVRKQVYDGVTVAIACKGDRNAQISVD